MTIRLALAAPRVAASVDDGLATAERLIAEAAAGGAAVVCFPEAWLPGLRGLDFDVPSFDATDETRVLRVASHLARSHGIAIVFGIELHTDAGRHIAAAVFDARGELLGIQTKNQLDPAEEGTYVAGHARRLFEIDGLRFGIAICHEGFRYPETVRWAARRDAQVVFHPHCTGSDRAGVVPARWADPAGAYYEKAMICRALENTVYLAGVNYAFRYQQSATAIIGPSGECLAHLPYGEEGVLVHDVHLAAATGLMAHRLAPDRLAEV